MTLDDIPAAVAAHYGLTQADLLKQSRFRFYVRPRQVAMYLAREQGRWSLPEIARCFDRHHTTVLHGVRQIEGMAHRPEIKSAIAGAKRRLAA